jgi:hypothetical protein
MSASHDSIAYVRWVQRSLNRIMGLQLATDGRQIGPWRGALGDFKDMMGIAEPGLDKFQIGPKAQNELVRLNALSTDYRGWLARNLHLGADTGDKLTAATRKFQKDHGLTIDGWVGPRTEAAMCAGWAEPPPGEYGANRSPAPRPAPQPVPEWLRAWKALPPSRRYLRWAEDVAAKVEATPAVDPDYRTFCNIIATSAQEDPRRYFLYFSGLSLQKVMNSNEPEFMNPGIVTKPDGRFTLPDRTLRAYTQTMATTMSLPMHLYKPTETPEAYARQREAFERDMLETFKAVDIGIAAWNARWSRWGDALHDRLFVVRGIIEALMKKPDHIYGAYAKQKSRKLDDAPGAMTIIMPWRWFDKARL